MHRSFLLEFDILDTIHPRFAIYKISSQMKNKNICNDYNVFDSCQDAGCNSFRFITSSLDGSPIAIYFIIRSSNINELYNSAIIKKLTKINTRNPQLIRTYPISICLMCDFSRQYKVTEQFPICTHNDH